MAPLFVDPQDPLASVANIEAVLHLLVAVAPIRFSPEAERGQFFLAGIVIESVAALARHLGHNPDPTGGAA
jgi:hypothetical protein